MKRLRIDIAILLILTSAVALFSLIAACGSDGDEDTQGETEVVIGNFTDRTGSSATAMEYIDMALEDAVEYYNEQGLIPNNVKVKVITYDGAYEPANDIPGYVWLKDRGADLIFTGVPHTPINLKARVNRDKMVLFTPSAARDTVYPPGYIFVPSTLPEDNAYTLMKWISENDSDFPSEGKAKIGAAGWSTPYNVALHDAMSKYTKVYPEKFDWVGSYTIDIGFNWRAEVEALKDCDYVMLPITMVNFAKQYRDSGYEGKFLGSGAQAAFLGLINDAKMWDSFDGTLFILPSGWWNDDTDIINRTKELLYEKHPDTADEIIEEGASYISIDAIYQVLDIIADAVEMSGPDGFDSDTLYEAAQSYSQTVDGVVRASFSETKRSSIDRTAIYEADGSQKDLFRLHQDWYPVVHSVGD